MYEFGSSPGFRGMKMIIEAFDRKFQDTKLKVFGFNPQDLRIHYLPSGDVMFLAIIQTLAALGLINSNNIGINYGNNDTDWQSYSITRNQWRDMKKKFEKIQQQVESFPLQNLVSGLDKVEQQFFQKGEKT